MSDPSNITEYIEAYMLHDPIGNVEGMVSNFDRDSLQSAEDEGMVFIAVYNTGKREIVKAQDVREPEPMSNGIKLVAPSYVDKRACAVVDVFDALAASIPIAEISEQPQPNGEANGSKKTFVEALETLRLLAYGTNDEGGER